MTTPGPAATIRVDCVIMGGGIAGLWARALLADAGFGIALVSDAPLGAGQTVASQGILHRGVKYAMSPAAVAAASALAQAHTAWDAALAGRGPIDLRSARVLSPCTHLWTPPGLLASMTAAAASLAMRSEVRRLARPDLPAGFATAPDRTAVWRVQEPCLDARSLVASLAANPAGPILIAGSPEFTTRNGAVTIFTPDVRIEARAALFAAGAGNESLLRAASIDPEPFTQRRPLRMTLARSAPFSLFGHCLQELSDKPRLTITSAEHEGGIVWYIGGDVAERGVSLTPQNHLDAVRRELAACLPWTDLRSLSLSQFTVDRAEARTDAGKRPDGPVLRAFGHLAALWPTKLALAPSAAAEALAWLRTALKSPRDLPHGPAAKPEIAPAPWGRKDLAWT